MNTRRHFLFSAVPALSLLGAESKPGGNLRLKLRSRVEAFKGSGLWNEVLFSESLPVKETALIICDMWDNHWCSGAAHRVTLLAPRINAAVEAARRRGIRIIHAPSDTMNFYKDAPQRQAMLKVPRVEPPPGIDLPSPPLPIDDSTGGCDTPADKFFKAWSREIATIRIADNDLISDNGPEVYSLLKRDGIKNLLVMGVHTNMCILNRTFAIKQMTRWGIRCILVRDLTDAMYNPGDRPFVSHAEGTEKVIQHIEKYWCPTTLSADLVSPQS
ncbi:MAG: isochorismatase [Bryobacteraceae bacterium]